MRTLAGKAEPPKRLVPFSVVFLLGDWYPEHSPGGAPVAGVPIRAEGASPGRREPVQEISSSNTRRTQLRGSPQNWGVRCRVRDLETFIRVFKAP